jgi:quercetin dioxygenase-like cupin family protein
MARSTTRWLSAMACGSFIECSIVGAGAQMPPKESKGQKARELCSIDLASEIDTGAGRRLRMRALTLEPGGMVAVHGHQDRPTVMVVTKGILLSHLAGKPDETLHVGDCIAEGNAVTAHWMENTGSDSVEYLAIDVFR